MKNATVFLVLVTLLAALAQLSCTPTLDSVTSAPKNSLFSILDDFLGTFINGLKYLIASIEGNGDAYIKYVLAQNIAALEALNKDIQGSSAVLTGIPKKTKDIFNDTIKGLVKLVQDLLDAMTKNILNDDLIDQLIAIAQKTRDLLLGKVEDSAAQDLIKGFVKTVVDILVDFLKSNRTSAKVDAGNPGVTAEATAGAVVV